MFPGSASVCGRLFLDSLEDDGYDGYDEDDDESSIGDSKQNTNVSS
jgi:hypothetical protein